MSILLYTRSGNADYWCSERALWISDWCSGKIKYNNFLRPFCAFRLLGFWAFEFLGFPASGILDFWAFGLLGFFWAVRLFNLSKVGKFLLLLFPSFFFFLLSGVIFFNFVFFLFSTKVLLLIFSDLVQRSYKWFFPI